MRCDRIKRDRASRFHVCFTYPVVLELKLDDAWVDGSHYEESE